jgi:hypothetical protein
VAARVAQGEVIGGRQNTYEVTSATFVLNGLSAFAQYAVCIIALYIAAGDRRRTLRLVVFFVALPVSLFHSLAFGGKSAILMALYSMVAAFHYVRRRVRLRTLSIGAVVAVLVVFPTVNAYRATIYSKLGGSPTSVSEFIATLNYIPQAFSGRGPAEYLGLATEGIMGRSTGIDSLSLIMKYGDDGQLGDPGSYLKVPLYSLIPRVIWPDKPLPRQSMMFGRMFVVPSAESSKNFASFGIFHIGDLYASFGPLGVLFGMCLLGCLYRLIYEWLAPTTNPDLGMRFIYILLLWTLTNGFESDIPTVFADCFKFLLIWFGIKLLFNVRVSPQPSGLAGRGWQPAAHAAQAPVRARP